jgi:hypothetical protein
VIEITDRDATVVRLTCFGGGDNMRSTQPIFGYRRWQAFKEIKVISERKINEFWAEIKRVNDKLPPETRLTFIRLSDGRELLSDSFRLVSGLSLVKFDGYINYIYGWHFSANNVIKSNGVYVYLEYDADIYSFHHILSLEDIDIILKNVRNQNVHLHQGLESNDDFVGCDIYTRRRGETRAKLGSPIKKGFICRLFS